MLQPMPGICPGMIGNTAGRTLAGPLTERDQCMNPFNLDRLEAGFLLIGFFFIFLIIGSAL